MRQMTGTHSATASNQKKHLRMKSLLSLNFCDQLFYWATHLRQMIRLCPFLYTHARNVSMASGSRCGT